MSPVKSVLRVGTRVINCYTLSKHHGKHGKIINFNSGVRGWNGIWARIKYDDGSEDAEMKGYLAREDEVTRLVCPKCKRETGYKSASGYEGNTYEIMFKCTECGYSWWIPEYLLKKMKVPEGA